MSTPRSKRPTRFGDAPRMMHMQVPDGTSSSGLIEPRFAQLIGCIITHWTHLEEAMIQVMSSLLGEVPGPGRQVFRAIISEHARVKVMTALLEQAAINRSKGRWYDDVIAEFDSLRKIRNNFTHGLWWTHEHGEVFFAEPKIEEGGYFNPQRKVSLSELEDANDRIIGLSRKIWFEVRQQHELPQRTLPSDDVS